MFDPNRITAPICPARILESTDAGAVVPENPTMIRCPRSLAVELRAVETLAAAPPEGAGSEITAAAIALNSGANKRTAV
jgi:hypothetical protein